MPTFANTINGNDILAKRSQCDYAGNDIQTTYATKTEVAAKQDAISDLATIRSGAAEGATAVQPGDLATVATSGSYNDLSDKPSIPAAQVNSDWNASSGVAEILNKPQLSTVATTGDYADLINKPSIPAAQVNSDWNAVSGVSEILNKPSIPSGTQLVPAATSADADKVLTVDSQGTPGWGTGGKTYTGTDGVVVDNVNDTVGLEAPVDIVAGPGISIDNPDGNTLRVSTDEDYEKELYVNTTVPYTDVNAVFTLSEPVTNFERIRVESWNREFQQYQATYEFTIAGSTTSTVFVMSMDHSESTSNIQRLNMRFSYNSDGNLVDKGHILFFGNGGSSASGNQRGLGIHRVVGIHRIQGGS